MGLFSAISEWRTQQYEKRISKMESKGICPDCRGKGFNMFANEYYYSPAYFECSGCNGSGSFQDWQASTE
ncbi:methionine aminopeptidase [Evansella sp. AB-P1]|uniref:methionine aminopeptidase n=1 Tax=Evansella sp. AB-P1 TaxID=3037653 RepID=UPI00241E1958|nr:methionine aminopeptidase [Evansella sp. AB-P1]MDG5786711.1 methionine aminopeptidase [Evansella sp. AB-P1]